MTDPSLSGLSILIAEDDPLVRKPLVAALEQMSAEVTATSTLAAARAQLDGASFDFALLDVHLPDGTGTDLLRDKVLGPGTGVIVMTAEGAITGAVQALQLGALDYLVKPFEPAQLALAIARARRTRQQSRIQEHRNTQIRSRTLLFGPGLAHLETQLQRILTADRRLTRHLSPILIEGETGTGKTTLARWIHEEGPRANQPLVEVNCSALPETLAESELFGHERGAFTDARTTRIGLFEAADGGTLFLDELPSLSPGLQAKVLTAIEDRKIRRVGSNKTIPVDARIIAAAQDNLKDLADAGSFRQDLFQRLNLFRLRLPPLRERRDDILPLAQSLLEGLCKRHQVQARNLGPIAIQRILRYAWPGNIRELAHELERAVVFEDASLLALHSLPLPDGEAGPATESNPTPGSESPTATPDPSRWFNPAFVFPESGFILDQAILRLIHHALDQSNQNVSAAARLLGVSRDFLRYRLDPRMPADRKPEGL